MCKITLCVHGWEPFSKVWYCMRLGVKPYACSMCDMRFFQRYHLARHSLTHTGMLELFVLLSPWNHSYNNLLIFVNWFVLLYLQYHNYAIVDNLPFYKMFNRSFRLCWKTVHKKSDPLCHLWCSVVNTVMVPMHVNWVICCISNQRHITLKRILNTGTNTLKLYAKEAFVCQD